MSWLRRPVLYRSQVQVWLVLAAAALVLTVMFVPAGRQQVIAFVVLGLAVVAAAVVWKVGEYRRYRLGPEHFRQHVQFPTEFRSRIQNS